MKPTDDSQLLTQCSDDSQLFTDLSAEESETVQGGCHRYYRGYYRSSYYSPVSYYNDDYDYGYRSYGYRRRRCWY